MFDFKCKAELRNINVRAEIHGDETVPAIDVKLLAIGVPVDKISSAIPDIAKHFYEKDKVVVGEVNPLTVQHKLENLTVKIHKTEVKGVDVKKKMLVTLEPGKVCDVEMSVQIQHATKTAAALMPLLTEQVDFEISERQQRLEAVK